MGEVKAGVEQVADKARGLVEKAKEEVIRK